MSSHLSPLPMYASWNRPFSLCLSYSLSITYIHAHTHTHTHTHMAQGSGGGRLWHSGGSLPQHVSLPGRSKPKAHWGWETEKEHLSRLHDVRPSAAINQPTGQLQKPCKVSPPTKHLSPLPHTQLIESMFHKLNYYRNPTNKVTNTTDVCTLPASTPTTNSQPLTYISDSVSATACNNIKQIWIHASCSSNARIVLFCTSTAKGTESSLATLEGRY